MLKPVFSALPLLLIAGRECLIIGARGRDEKICLSMK